MILLIGLVFVIQVSFFWFLQPLIVFFTPLTEFRSFEILIICLGLWLLSGGSGGEELE